MFSIFKKKAAPSVPERPLAPHKLGFSLEYWRQRQDLVDETQKVYRTRWFQEWISVLHHELPLDSSIEAVRAHKRLLRIMELMATPPERLADELVPTFGAEKEFPELSGETDNPT